MAYKLTLTDSDFDTIAFVGDRYCWSAALLRLANIGENDIPEPDAWDIRDAFEADTEGGHSPFPMLGASDLRDKLVSFWDGIV